MPDEIVASGAGDGEVRIHRLGRDSNDSQGGVRVLACHARRVKKLAVEEGNPYMVWSASEDGTLRQHDLRERGGCRPGLQVECRSVLVGTSPLGGVSSGACGRPFASLANRAHFFA
jgi:WD and tetratricopeptide repeat-containing protein 1